MGEAGSTRREFLRRITATVVLGGGASLLIAATAQGQYRIAPLPGYKYGPGFARICRRRFNSADEAVLSIRNETVEFLVVRE